MNTGKQLLVDDRIVEDTWNVRREIVRPAKHLDTLFFWRGELRVKGTTATGDWIKKSRPANALRALIGSDFLRLANALSALYPQGCNENRLLDAMLLALPR